MKNLIDFSFMGAALHKSTFENEDTKVAILNIGSEELKGNSVIKYISNLMKKNSLFEFKGYIEKSYYGWKCQCNSYWRFYRKYCFKNAEGTANFISSELKSAYSSSFLGKISALLNIKNLKNFKKKLDPRLYNGAILLGLDKPVIKSHGSTDEIGFANSLKVCEKIIKSNLIDKIKKNII